jgi:O-methyltransferase domain
MFPKTAMPYLLKAILHDWDTAASIAILQNCRRAVKPHGKLLVRLLGFSSCSGYI